MRKNILLLWTVMATVVCSAQQVYNVHEFGAKGNGVHIDSRAINEAISQAYSVKVVGRSGYQLECIYVIPYD